MSDDDRRAASQQFENARWAPYHVLGLPRTELLEKLHEWPAVVSEQFQFFF